MTELPLLFMAALWTLGLAELVLTGLVAWREYKQRHLDPNHDGQEVR